MKTIKRTFAVLLTLLMLMSAVPVGVVNVAAADNPIKTILDRVESVYSAGTYFTANRKACNHASTTTCNNCKLATILDSADCKTIKRYSNSTYNANTWTCFSFASFCFTQCFGKSYVSDNYNKTIDSNDLFGTRTDFSNQSVELKKQFFSYGKIGDIIKCFRYAKGDDGKYHYYHKHSMVFISADSTGVTVFDANVGGNDSHTGTVRKAKIKYENIKHYNIEILHAKNYSAVAGQAVVTVTFNGNGGTPTASSRDYIVGEEYGTSFPTALRNGYSFDGWYTSASGGTKCYISDKASSNVKTLYAHWSKNNTGALKVGHIYKIYNKNSGLPLQTNSDGAGAYVCQRAEATTANQLWRVTYADANGYYKFESLQGLNALNMNGTPGHGYRNLLQISTPNNSDAQIFSLVKREDKAGSSGYYSIHCKSSGMVIDVKGASKEAGANLQQYFPHFGGAQLFCFVEQTDRRVFFFDNHNNNYLPSPREVYNQIGSTTPTNHYSSRDTSYVTVTINPTEDSLIIKQLKAGSTTQGAIAGDMKWPATLNGSYAYDVCELNDSTMTLHFKAKSSVAGAKMHFRWGYTTNWYSVALTTGWADYTIDLPRDRRSGGNLHPVIDKACTVEIKDISMYEKGVTDVYIGDTDTFSVVRVDGNVNSATSCYTPLPTRTKAGYTFDGWYTKRVGGTKVANGNDYFDVSSLTGHINLYAHWVKNTPVHVHTYTSAVTKAATCSATGVRTYTCSCGDSYTETIVKNPSNHVNTTNVTATASTCTVKGYSAGVYCNDCKKYISGHQEQPLAAHTLTTINQRNATCTAEGYTGDQYCTTCKQTITTGTSIGKTAHTLTVINQRDATYNAEGYTGDQYCTTCKQTISTGTTIPKLEKPTDPTPTDPTPTDPIPVDPQPDNLCPWCGQVHEGFIQMLIAFFHNIFAAIFGARY
ncbi:MAG: InlB B-repeat-containing protein [Clostridia bacterium]|nr:InlB B-repeat-containing protein [Clostridia bacterium]